MHNPGGVLFGDLGCPKLNFNPLKLKIFLAFQRGPLYFVRSFNQNFFGRRWSCSYCTKHSSIAPCVSKNRYFLPTVRTVVEGRCFVSSTELRHLVFNHDFFCMLKYLWEMCLSQITNPFWASRSLNEHLDFWDAKSNPIFTLRYELMLCES